MHRGMMCVHLCCRCWRGSLICGHSLSSRWHANATMMTSRTCFALHVRTTVLAYVTSTQTDKTTSRSYEGSLTVSSCANRTTGT